MQHIDLHLDLRWMQSINDYMFQNSTSMLQWIVTAVFWWSSVIDERHILQS